jgi:hypothetical protein
MHELQLPTTAAQEACIDIGQLSYCATARHVLQCMITRPAALLLRQQQA